MKSMGNTKLVSPPGSPPVSPLVSPPSGSWGLPIYDEVAAAIDARVQSGAGWVHIVGLMEDGKHRLVVTNCHVDITPTMLVSDLENLSGMDTDCTANTVFLNWEQVGPRVTKQQISEVNFPS